MSGDDISHLLNAWPFDPKRTTVRLIEGEDGRPKLQIRVLLGVLQLEVTGRPDGVRPDGAESLLALHRERLSRYEEATGGVEGFVLSPDDCRALRDEAALFHHRYVGLFVLEDYEGVIRDATHNLGILDLCRDFAATDEDRQALERFRPSIIMMRTRAQATRAIAAGDTRGAIVHLDAGLQELRRALDDLGMGDRAEESNEMQLLRGMREALVPQLPMSQRVELENRLRKALEAENYELAAILRDELRQMKE